MAERWFVPETKVEKIGIFDGRTVHAMKLVNERGQMGWEVRTWADDGSQVDGYWIAYGEIREIAQPPDFKIGRFIVEMDDAKRDILLNAIMKWQEEEIERLCT